MKCFHNYSKNQPYFLPNFKNGLLLPWHFAKSQLNLLGQIGEGSKEYVAGLLGSLMGTFGTAALIPVYVFLLLLYKRLLLNFFNEIFESSLAEKIANIQVQVQSAIQSYLVGLMIEMIIVAIMNSVALLILGVESAILLGVIGAILNVIPYIGGLVAILLPVIIAFVTEDSYHHTHLGGGCIYVGTID